MIEVLIFCIALIFIFISGFLVGFKKGVRGVAKEYEKLIDIMLSSASYETIVRQREIKVRKMASALRFKEKGD